jgi:ribosomal protein S24E
LSTVEVVNERDNKLLARREYVLNFKGGSGLVSRKAAADAIAGKLGVAKEGVKIISLSGKHGVRDLKAVAYVYSDTKVISKQLPKYMALRELSKEDRKKAREAAKAKQVPAAEAKKA